MGNTEKDLFERVHEKHQEKAREMEKEKGRPERGSDIPGNEHDKQLPKVDYGE